MFDKNTIYEFKWIKLWNLVDDIEFNNLSERNIFYFHTLSFSELLEILQVLLIGVTSEWIKNGYNASLIFPNYSKLNNLWRKVDTLQVQNLPIG